PSSWTPGPSAVGNHVITYRATDVGGLFVERTINVLVQSPTPPPRFVAPTPGNGSVLSVTVGHRAAFTVRATGAAGSIVILRANGVPAGASQSPPLPTSGNPVSSAFSWTPGPDDVGRFTLKYRAQDTLGQFV